MDYDINPIKIKVQYSYKDYKEYFKFSRFKGRLYKLRLRLFFINYPIFVGIITFISFIVSILFIVNSLTILPSFL